MAQLALNAKVSDTTKITSFFVNFNKESNLFNQERRHLTAQSVIERIATLKKVHNNIALVQIRSIKYQNKKRKMAPQLKKKNKMYLLTKNLKIRKKSKKLDHVKVEPFFIKAVKESVNYELDLSKDARVFLVFYISLLESVDPSTSIQETFHYYPQEENRFEVERILEKKGQRYLVKWKKYSTTENTWESISNLDDYDTLIQRFHQHSRNHSA
jgi:hypothetical protein